MSDIKKKTMVEETTKISCQWEIENFMEKLEKCEGGFFTTIFESDESTQKARFQLKFNILGLKKDLLEIYYLSSKSIFTRTTLSLKKRNYQHREVAEHDWKNVHSNTWQYVTGLMTAHIKEDPQDFIFIGGKLVLFLKVEMMKSVKFPSTRHFIQDSFHELLDTGDLSDLQIISCDNRTFNVHKLILTCRSPVFAAMFKHDMQEGNTNVIRLADFDGEVLEQLLSYIYTDNCPKLIDMAADLLHAADKYELSGLKSLCEEAIFENVTSETAVNVLKLSVKYNAVGLKKLVLKYIKDGQTKAILRSGEWRDVDSCDLFKDLLEILLL